MKYAILLLALLVFCSTATLAQPDESLIEVTAGTHHCNHESGTDEWFIYRPDNPTWVILSSVNKTDADTYVEVYHEGNKTPFLRSDDYQNAQSRVKFIAEADSTYIIKWRKIYAETGYDWDCIEEDLGPGEHYTTAIVVTDDTMEYQISPGNSVWYKYISDENQWVGMESSFHEFEIYQTSVDEKHLIQTSIAPFRYNFSFSPQKEELYYFHWENEGRSQVDLSWMLTTKTSQEGKTVEMSEELPINQVTEFDAQNGLDHWYHYKSDSAGILNIHPRNNSNLMLEVWEKQSGTKVDVDVVLPEWESEYLSFNYKKDIEYLLRLRNQISLSFNAEKINLEAGAKKFNPKEVTEGVHFAKTRYNTGEWFRYRSNTAGNVLIATQYDAFAETTIHLYDEASGIMLASDTTENFQEKEGKLVFPAEKSVSYLIYIGNSGHSSIEGIYWDLKKDPHSCSAPQLISPENKKNLLGNTDYWFEYTASKRSKVSVNATGLEKEEQYVDIQFYRSCDSMIVEGENHLNIYLDAGEKILIRTKGHYIESLYDILLNETEQSIGLEEFPLEITSGNHQIQTNTDHWFIYHPQSTGKIEVDMPDDLSPMPRLEIYRQLDNSKFVTTRSQDFGKAATRCKPGEPLYIHWLDNDSDASFEWTITEKETVPGDLVTNALEAHEGINEMIKTNRMPNWYYYVPQSLGSIRISTCDLTEEDTFIAVYDSINQSPTSIYSGNACGLQSEVLFDCNPNDTVFFIWYEDYSNNPYPFSISETPSAEGSERRNARKAINGWNEVTFTKTNVQWLEYTASIEGRIILSNCRTEASFFPDIEVFENNSSRNEDVESQDCGENQKTIQFEIKPGNTYYIKFHSNTSGTGISMDWNLEEAAFEEGTHCSTPIEIDEGLHASNSNKARWYSYTAKSNAEITLSRCNIEDNIDILLHPKIYKNCDQKLNRVETIHCSPNKKHSFVALKDSTYFITWGYVSDYKVQWELTEATYPTNGFCRDAKEVLMGINHAEHSGNNDIWYKFTSPHDGYITLNSVGFTEQDTKVEFHSGCSDGVESTEIYSNDNYYGNEQARLRWSCEANETYYIRWRGEKVTAPYDWEFTYIAQGDDKEDPLEACVGENEKTQTENTSQYFAFENSSDGHFYEITIPHQEGKKRKLNILPRYESWYGGIYFNADSTEAEIQRPFGGSYIIECISEPGDSFTWTIEKRYMDTLSVKTQLLGHTGFMNDWFVLSGEENAFYTIESDKPQSAFKDIDLYVDYPTPNEKLNPLESSLRFPVYQFQDDEEHYIKWAMPKKGKTDYWWSLVKFDLSGSSDCIDAQPARPGDIHTTFNSSRLMYKMRLDKSGRYMISANSEEFQRLGIERLNLYSGTCNNKVWEGFIDFSDGMSDEDGISSITLDSIAKNTSYYLEWEFDFFRNQIKEFSWNLKLDTEHDVGIKKSESEYFLISKNPNNGRFEVLCPELTEETNVEIYNISGKKVYSEIIQPPTNQHSINISGSQAGIYLIAIRNSKYNITTKIIIQQD